MRSSLTSDASKALTLIVVVLEKKNTEKKLLRLYRWNFSVQKKYKRPLPNEKYLPDTRLIKICNGEWRWFTVLKGLYLEISVQTYYIRKSILLFLSSWHKLLTIGSVIATVYVSFRGSRQKTCDLIYISHHQQLCTFIHDRVTWLHDNRPGQVADTTPFSVMALTEHYRHFSSSLFRLYIL